MKVHEAAAGKLRKKAHLFAALGDETRLALLLKLGTGRPCSITQLAEGETVTRQAISKHLRVLEEAGLIHGTRSGRENLFQADPGQLQVAKDALDIISRQWDDALARLKSFVEDNVKDE